MAQVRSVNFLPEIFQTDANKQFLAATLDQLVQEPKFKKTQGFIGRKVGPGVNPDDKYVVEPTKSRTDYQLETGVISLDPENTSKIQDAITYPGLGDAISFQGGNGDRPDRLYTSEYYTYDPFVNLDPFVNASQYYWVPDGPPAVSVFSDAIPYNQNFVVTRANGVYTMSGQPGNNPMLELVRGGTYSFQVANNKKETINFRVTNSGIASYQIDYEPNPTLTLARGNTYIFTLNTTAEFPFWIKTEPITGIGSAYNSGVTNNGGKVGTVKFVVPQDAPDTLYYSAENNANMHGQINIVNNSAGTGPGFWIQTQPGISGHIASSPNISSRDVYGVYNNGEDLGTVTFTVPKKTDQNFYYTLNDIGGVDFATDLKFNQINNVGVERLIALYGGIDGNKSLDGKTLIFLNRYTDTIEGGWIRSSTYDPLPELPEYNSQAGSYDSLLYALETPVPENERWSVWQINYVTVGTYTYATLRSVKTVNILDKVTVQAGTSYSNTQWYKNQSGFFEKIPLLSAVLDTLYYQDGTDPEIFGTIKLVDQAKRTEINVNDILGQKNYTSPATSYYPNGVEFTNGLKVKFIGLVTPSSYWSGTIVVNCSETISGVNLINCTSTLGLLEGEPITFADPTGGLEEGVTYYIKNVLSSTQFSVSLIRGGATVGLTSSFGSMTGTMTSDKEYYVSGVGTAIELLPVSNFIVPEGYATDANTETVYIEPSDADYITIDRAGKDLNAWTRSNRWFHTQVLSAAAEYNRITIDKTQYQAGKRPIIEFRPDIRLYNMGARGKTPVDVIDFVETDALSNIEGSTGYTLFVDPVKNIYPNAVQIGTAYKITALGNTNWNVVAGTTALNYSVGDTFIAVATGTGTGTVTPGYIFANNTRVIFAADEDPYVRNKIFVVNFVSPDSQPLTLAGNFRNGSRYVIQFLGTTDWNEVADTIGQNYNVGQEIIAVNPGTGTGTARFAEPIINLVPSEDGEILTNDSTVCLSGTQAGLTYWYDGVTWSLAQQKTQIQQAPLFNVYDANGVSLSDRTTYPGSTFEGSKLFSYAIGTGLVDSVLNFQLAYQTINNLGDIVFDNNLYADTFQYVLDNVTYSKNISIGCPRQYLDRTNYQRLLGWQTAVVPSFVRQQFKFIYDGFPLVLDVKVLSDQVTVVPAVKIYVGGNFQPPTTYIISTDDNTTTISFIGAHVLGEVIEVDVLSDQVSKTAFYTVPMNLSQNPLNKNSDRFTLGTMRTHYDTICENLTSLVGPINGSNNSRDLGNIIPYGQLILQQSSPLTLAAYFMRSQKYNIFAALEYNSREYQKYKGQLLELSTKQDIDYNIPVSQLLDTVIMETVRGKTSQNPFYWSDMLPATEVYTTTTYTLSCFSTPVFDTVYVHNYTSANYLGMNVYVNNVLLIRGVDYTVGIDSPTITLLAPLINDIVDNDILTIQEYPATYGTFVPNTPTKLGLYPAWKPGIIPVKTSKGVQLVILGHDGSQTPLFNDIRDQVLLEFETRIYNNLKLDGNPVPLVVQDVIPGQFRNTGYSYDEINQILGESFLSYVGWNKLNYTIQDYNEENSFTYNYSRCLNKLNNENLLGAWRGIYRYFYDTQQPEEAPWEMLGFTVRPEWWEITYGPAPYTRDNQILWDDLEAGLVRDPIAPYIIPKYVRPGLTKVLPTGTEGELLSPLYSVVGLYGDDVFRKSWTVGDGGPVEASWWNSSDYPFAAMRLLALTRTAEFFALFADRDLYRFNDEFQQYLYNNRYRLDATDLTIYGTGTSKASFIDWIVDYNKVLGQESTVSLENDLANLDVRLCYRMASFSDKQYIQLYTERSSPGSTNSSFLIPDQSYSLLLYKNQPFSRSVYSGVVIQVVENGYAVFGYSTSRPYFNTLTSVPAGQFKTFVQGTTSLQVPTFYTETITRIPYGYIFTSESAVANFLLSYGQYLAQTGFSFTNQENGYILTWDRMVEEFMYWVNQGWTVGSLINLNPLADRLSVNREGAVVDSIKTQTSENLVLDQNRKDLSTKNLNIVRYNNEFTMESLNDQTISFVDIRYTSYENMIVLDNTSLFGDLIYEPITGARQGRLGLIASTSTDWTGTVNAQGFILNQDNIQEWTGLKTYPKGELVKYKGKYWSAATIVQPSSKFNYNDWNQSDYTMIELGMLPNLANKANQLANSYDINSANLEADNDLLSYGLIGFRPRQYLTDLNLDDVSQLNVYRQFIDTKGTILSADLLTNANFGKEASQYQIFENWALQRSAYGANANRRFFDLRLNREYLTSDPALVAVVFPGGTSQADQVISLPDVWKSSFVPNSPDFLPTTTISVTDVALPTAGYVNLDDVDVTVFELTDPTSIAAALGTVQNGTIIWVAKINDYDWNVYRTQNIYGDIQHVCDNLDGTSRVIFSGPHGLSLGDQLIIKFFDTEVNGVYKILQVVDLNTVNIAFTFTNNRVVANGSGIGFILQTMRVSQASDIVNLSYAKSILPGAKVWVDNNGDGLWEVLEKQDPFTGQEILRPVTHTSNEQFGASVAQNADYSLVLVGSPRLEFGSGSPLGGVYVYKNSAASGAIDFVSPNAPADDVLQLTATGTRGFGNAVDFGRATWALAGASQSLGPNGEANNGYTAVLKIVDKIPSVYQLLVIPGSTHTTTPGAGEFGYSVAMGADERWAYIGAPGINTVYAYGRVDATEQSMTVKVTGSAVSTLVISGSIRINNILQLLVSVNNILLAPSVDYSISVDYSTITFTSPVAVGSTINVQRKTYVNLTSGGTSYAVSQYLYTASNIYSITVRVGGQYKRPNVDYTFNGTTIQFYSAAGDTVTVSAEAYYEYVAALTVPGIDAGARLGHSVQCTSDGRQIIVGAPNNHASGTISAISSSGVASSGYKVFESVAQYSTSGVGINANFSVTCYNNSYIVTVTDPGANYAAYDTILIKGSAVGGTDSVNDLTITVRQVVDLTQAGNVYVFDRNVQEFIVTSPSTLTYTVLGSPAEPINVKLNNQFLTNQLYKPVGATNTFTVSGNSVTLNAALVVGDVIQVETNQFKLAQTITQDSVAEFTNFGQALDLCPYDCSLYIGAPQDSTTAFKGGIVQRNVAQARTYGTITSMASNPSLTAGHTIRVNNIDVAVPAYPNNNVAGLASAINNFAIGSQTGVPNAAAEVNGRGQLVIYAKNPTSEIGNKLQVSPGSVGTAFDSLRFETFAFTQTIASPLPTDYAEFGYSLAVNDTALSLAVGAPQANLYLPTTFDYDETLKKPTTTFDGNSTVFFYSLTQSGAVYTYDYMASSDNTLANPGKFIFGQQISSQSVRPYDLLGTSLSYSSAVLLVGAPKNDNSLSDTNYGAVFTFLNQTLDPAWKVIHQQQPVVDVTLINSVYMYDRLTSERSEFFDFFNPLQGKILGAAQENIDYISAVDPASYNVGYVNNRGNTWGAEHVGEIWWDISTVRFIDPNQDNIVYASRRWGQVFPGSVIDVYQWVESDYPPSSYVGSGTPITSGSYVISTKLNSTGLFNTTYYFWVKNVTETFTQQGKTLSAFVVAQYIEAPKSSGISYIAPINASTIAIYNGLQYINAADTIISIEYDQIYNNDNVHIEYELIAQGRSTAFMSNMLYSKFIDSFAGIDESGNLVPDPSLPESEKYGVQFRPRQSMFANRFMALKNYITRVNSVLKLYPISETRAFSLLNSEELPPSASSGAWDFACANNEILSYQNIYDVPLDYNYLVESDSDYNGMWTIYTVVASPADNTVRQLDLTRIQSYKTNNYWSYIDWYQPGYNPTTKVSYEVPNYVNLKYLSATLGASAKVTANAQGKWEIYLLTDLGWERVGLQNGTIALSNELYTYGFAGYNSQAYTNIPYDSNPQVETRKIIQAINEELLIDELLIERNKAMTLMFDFILSEFTAPEWLVKTSLIDVDHNVRQLLPFPNYVLDNQDFVSDYLQEVKPYHVQVREFNLSYSGIDDYTGDLTDFDVPAYYNADLLFPQYVSPILLPYAHSSAQLFNTVSDTPLSSVIWSNWPYSQWITNYSLSLDYIKIVSQGSGYVEPPIIHIIGDAVEPATAVATINSLGDIAIIITNHGKGYTATPTIVFESAVGSGAKGYAVMTNGLVRSFKTVIRYDRYQYQTSIFEWSATSSYVAGDKVRYNNLMWEATVDNGPGVEFSLAEWTLVDVAATEFVWDPSQGYYIPVVRTTGVDRTMGLYVPDSRQPGLELPLLVNGVTYPGVQVYGPDFTQHQSQITVTVTETIGIPVGSSSNVPLNYVVCSSTEPLLPDMRISFAGTAFGNIQVGQVYYVYKIIDDTTFTISLNNSSEDQVEFDLYSSQWYNTTITNWNISNSYNINDAVYAPNGSIRQAIRQISADDNISIDNTLYWNEYPVAYQQGSVVINNGSYYSATSNVPPGIVISDTTYWLPISSPVSLTGTVLVPVPLDAIYESYFGIADESIPPNPPYPSDRLTDINVEGGKFIDIYEGHAPEELVNGSEFDTLDFRVYTCSGSDWTGNGHGFPFKSVRYTYGTAVQNYSWANVVKFPAQIIVSNMTTDLVLELGVDYTVDWVNQTIAFIAGVSVGDAINIDVYQVGGGAQLYQTYLTGKETGDSIVVPVQSTLIESIALFVNGSQLDVSGWIPYYSPATAWDITQTYSYNDVVYEQAVGVASISGTVLTVTSLTSGVIGYGTKIIAPGVVPGTFVTGSLGGIGGTGTYTVNNSQSFASNNFTGQVLYYRAITDVPVGISLVNYEYWQSTIVDPSAPEEYQHTFTGANRNSVFELPNGVTATDGISIAVMGYTSPVQRNWSLPVVQYITADSTIRDDKILYPTNSLQGTNPANLILNRNGARLTPPAGIEWYGDGTETVFDLPSRIGPPGNILDEDVQVWVDNVLQTQGTIYSVIPWDSVSPRQIEFVDAPEAGSVILISVSTYADYTVEVSPTTLINLNILPNLGDVFAVITFNDTSEQDICTEVFVGPMETGFIDNEPYSSTTYSPLPNDGQWNIANSYNVEDVVFTQTYISPGLPAPGTLPVFYKALQVVPPGIDISDSAYWEVVDMYPVPTSYDYTLGQQRYYNEFVLNRTDLSANRLWVTLDGLRLFDGVDYVLDGQQLILSQTIGIAQVLVVSEFTASTVPDPIAFRIFQDMRRLQTTYRITDNTTAIVSQPVTATDNAIYVDNLNNLSEPDLAKGILGAVTIDGERILYRARNFEINAIVGLHRGTAGTAAAAHNVGSAVYDIGQGNQLMKEWQDYADVSNQLGDGSTLTYVASNLQLESFDTNYSNYVEVYVGGIKQTSGYTVNYVAHSPTVTVVFDSAPAAGQMVSLAVRHGKSWYTPGVTTASNGVALQETYNEAARFLRGLT